MQILPMALMAGSAVVSIIGQQDAARSQQQALDYQAKQQEQKAGQERASAQRQAFEARRQSRLAISRAQAVAGGGGTDETVLNLTGNLAAEGEYNALTELYEGEQSALGREMQAKGLRAEGKAARRAANWKSASTVFGTASSMFAKFGDGGFGAPSNDESWRTRGSGMPS